MALKKSIKTRFITILLLSEALIVAGFLIAIYLIFENNIRESSLQVVKNIQGFYSSLITNDTKMLAAALDTFSANDTFKHLFSKNDTDGLLKASKELFAQNRSRYGITHFYYIDNQGICTLRVHQPDLRGDKITRATFEAAKKTGRVAAGLEMGKTAAYALRVVMPYTYNGNQIGFLEFGEEIDHFNSIVKKETGIDVVMLGDKSFLNEDQYKATRQAGGKPDNWKQLRDYIILDDTFGQQANFVSKIFDENEAKGITQAVYLGTFDHKDLTYIKGAFPFYSMGDKQTGIVYVLSDVTQQLSKFRWLFIYVLGGGILVFIASFLVSLHYMQTEIINPIVNLVDRAENLSLGKGLDDEITTNREDEIGLLTRAFERMRISLSKVMQMLSTADTSN